MTCVPGSHVYALLDGAVVTNIVVATPEFVATLGDAVRVDHLVPTPGVGWTYEHRRFTPPPPRFDPFAEYTADHVAAGPDFSAR